MRARTVGSRCSPGGHRRVRVRPWRTSRAGTHSSWWRSRAPWARPSWSIPASACSRTERLPASSAAHIQTRLTLACPEGRWRRPAPSLASRMRSSMSVRRRNHASRVSIGWP
jgi:hypothetical protein